MKTKDFISATRELGLNISENHAEIVITDVRNYQICNVSKLNCFSMNTRGAGFINLESDVKEKLLTYLYEYAKTPLEEREEEKKYRYKFPFRLAVTEIEKEAHLRKEELRKNLSFIVVDTSGVDFAKKHSDFHFTDKEVEQFTGKNRTLFNACEKIEVTP